MQYLDEILLHLDRSTVANDAPANFVVYKIFSDGVLAKTDFEKALFHLRASADKDYPFAQLELAKLSNPNISSIFEQMNIIGKNEVVANKLVDRASDALGLLADGGDAYAMLVLGMLYSGGLYPLFDFNLALRWLTKAYENGIKSAPNYLVLLYYQKLIQLEGHDPAVYAQHLAECRRWQIILKHDGSSAFDSVLNSCD